MNEPCREPGRASAGRQARSFPLCAALSPWPVLLLCVIGSGCRHAVPPPDAGEKPGFARLYDGGSTTHRMTPYVQDPQPDGVSLMWFSETPAPGLVRIRGPWKRLGLQSQPVPADEISDGWSRAWQPPAAVARFRHELAVEGLASDTVYRYEVVQGADSARGRLRTAPGPRDRRPLRLVAFADSETEPTSRRQNVGGKPYPLTEDEGFAANLRAVRSRRPDLLIVAGDLVASGGRQEDWDRFFAHLLGPAPGGGLASSVPIVAALGNHDYYGPTYAPADSEAAVAKFRTYFRSPSNRSPVAEQHDRYYRLDYGPAAVIVLDTNNGPDDDPSRDTNQSGLVGEGHGGKAPDWQPGSRQYAWLEEQLRDAHGTKAFTFVVFHHMPWSSGPHAKPAGQPSQPGRDPLSGVPLRELDPLFHQYGVHLVICGHDEILELSATTAPDGSRVDYWDVGIAGDGLRAPLADVVNPARVFVAADAPEGRHYGFLQIDLWWSNGVWRGLAQPWWIDPATGNIGGAYAVGSDLVGRK